MKINNDYFWQKLTFQVSILSRLSDIQFDIINSYQCQTKGFSHLLFTEYRLDQVAYDNIKVDMKIGK